MSALSHLYPCGWDLAVSSGPLAAAFARRETPPYVPGCARHTTSASTARKPDVAAKIRALAGTRTPCLVSGYYTSCRDARSFLSR